MSNLFYFDFSGNSQSWDLSNTRLDANHYTIFTRI